MVKVQILDLYGIICKVASKVYKSRGLASKHKGVYSSSPKKTLTGNQESPQTLKRSGRLLRVFISSSVNDQPLSWKLPSILEAVTDLGMTEVPRWRPHMRLLTGVSLGLIDRDLTLNLQDLSSGLALALGNLLQCLVVGKRRVGGAEAGVGSAVDALLLAVVDELGGGVVGVKLDLVDGGDGLARLILEEDLEVLNGEVGDTDVLDAARGRQLLELSPVSV
jgi:hypothetical protein